MKNFDICEVNMVKTWSLCCLQYSEMWTRNEINKADVKHDATVVWHLSTVIISAIPLSKEDLLKMNQKNGIKMVI